MVAKEDGKMIVEFVCMEMGEVVVGSV